MVVRRDGVRSVSVEGFVALDGKAKDLLRFFGLTSKKSDNAYQLHGLDRSSALVRLSLYTPLRLWALGRASLSFATDSLLTPPSSTWPIHYI